METVASAAVIESEVVDYVKWPEPGEPGAWGEMAVVGFWEAFPLGATPYAVRRAPASSSSDLARELEDWLAAGVATIGALDRYIDVLDELDNNDNGEG